MEGAVVFFQGMISTDPHRTVGPLELLVNNLRHRLQRPLRWQQPFAGRFERLCLDRWKSQLLQFVQQSA